MQLEVRDPTKVAVGDNVRVIHRPFGHLIFVGLIGFVLSFFAWSAWMQIEVACWNANGNGYVQAYRFMRLIRVGTTQVSNSVPITECRDGWVPTETTDQYLRFIVE